MWNSNAQQTRRVFPKTESAKRLCDAEERQDEKEDSTADASRTANCGENVRQYLLNSTLHGLRYVGERHITIFERTFFLLAFLLVVFLSFYFISNIYQKWSATPIIIGLNAVATSISDFPFPAVTICNMNQARRTIVEGFAADSVEKALLQSLCHQESGNRDPDDPMNPAETAEEDDGGDHSDVTGKWQMFRQFLLDVSQPCAEMLLYCRFATHTERCMELFNTVLTDDGLCCTFNSVHPMYLYQKYNDSDEFDSVSDNGDLEPSDWTPEDGWPGTVADRSGLYPRPAAGSGSHMGLIVVLNASIADYFCSSTNSKGFKILLHNPTETPKITDYGFSITTGRETRVVINPRLSDASMKIKSVPKAQRQCVFANEGNLSYFRTYSRKNCEMECESRIIEQICGCVQYHMPQTHGDTKICSRKDATCYEGVSLAIDLAVNETFACRCLPGCFEIYYKPSMYTSSLGSGGFTMRNKFLNDVSAEELNSSIAVLHIYYEESIFRSNTKEELIGFTEFLSSTGGLLGLFMGFSVVSLIEIIYFVSLRPYCAHRRTKSAARRLSRAGSVTGGGAGEKAAPAAESEIVRAWYISAETPLKQAAPAVAGAVQVQPLRTEFVRAAEQRDQLTGSWEQRWRRARNWWSERLSSERSVTTITAIVVGAEGRNRRWPYTD